MSIQGVYLMPHPPILLPEIGRGAEKEVTDTVESMTKIADEISNIEPEVIVIITPHGLMFEDAVSIAYEEFIEGDLETFGHKEISMKLDIDIRLADEIYYRAHNDQIPVVKASNNLLSRYNSKLYLDHGAMIPLYFINKRYQNYQLLHITYAPLSDIELYRFGIKINEAIESLGRKAVFIASGDLSHKLKDRGPYRYSEFGEIFDKAFLENLEKGDAVAAINMDENIVVNAGECGRRSVIMLLGVLDKNSFEGKVLSYQGNFGVGYGVVKFEIKQESESKIDSLKEFRISTYNNRLREENPYVRLARESLTSYIKTGSKIEVYPEYITDEMQNNRSGVFVSIKKKGELRGCIGTILPTRKNIVEEIIYNAIEAGTRDPRFYKISEEELFDVAFSVDVLTEPQIAQKKELNPLKYGVIVVKDNRKGVLLPNLEGVNTVEEQLSIALKKAGIMPEEEYDILKFEVERYK